MNFTAVIGIAFLLLVSPLLGNASVIPSDELSYFKEDSIQLSIKEIQDLSKNKWAPPPSLILVSPDSHWFHYKKRIDSAGSFSFYMIGNYSVQAVDFYLVKSGVLVEQAKTGSLVPVPLRSNKGRNFGFDFKIDEPADVDIFVRIHGSFSFSPSFYLDPSAESQITEIRINFLLGSFVGLLLFGILYSVMAGRGLYRSSLYSYAFFALTMILVILVLYGGWDPLFDDYLSKSGYVLSLIGSNFPVLGGLYFMASFLDTKERIPWAYKLALSLSTLILLTSLMRINFPWSSVIDVIHNYVILLMAWILFLTTGIVAVRKKIPYSKYFLFSWGIFFCGIAYLFSSYAPGGQLTMNRYLGPVIGQACELLVLTYALTLNFREAYYVKQENHQLGLLLRVLSHDLATPIQIIESSTRRAKDCIDPVFKELEVKSNLEKIERNTRTLTSLLSEVRGFLLMKMEVEPIEKTVFDLSELPKLLQEAYMDKLSEKEIDLVVEGDWSGSNRIYGQKIVFVNSIFGNLVTNAIKFSRTGSVIRLIMESNKNYVTIKVIDVGIGMSQQIIDKLFLVGERVSRVGTNGEPGTGFGMLIAKGYVEKCRGNMTVESVEGSGTTIKLQFPTIDK